MEKRSNSATLSMYLEEFCACLEKAKQAKAVVLVHSHLGVGRSVALVIAYLMKAEHWPLSKALKYVKDRRSFIQLSRNTMRSLMDIEISLGLESSMGQQQPTTLLEPIVKKPTILVLSGTDDEDVIDIHQTFTTLSALSPRVKYQNKRFSAIV